MSKVVFRQWNVDQGDLFPPAFKDLVPADHLVHFIRRVVAEDLDLSAIYGGYTTTRGQPPYHPGLMTALLLYGYCRGVYTSRKIEVACGERLDFRALVGSERPDHSTIAEFRKRHRDGLAALFVQVLALCRDAGMVKLGHVALDGTKMMAVFGAIVGFCHLIDGFTNRQLVNRVSQLRVDAAYNSRHATYDLRRLRRKGLIVKIPKSHRYQLTADGRRVAVLFTKAFNRVLTPGLSLLDPNLPSELLPRSPLATAWRKLEQSLERFADEPDHEDVERLPAGFQRSGRSGCGESREARKANSTSSDLSGRGPHPPERANCALVGALSSIVDQLGYRPREMHGPTAPKEAATDTASSLQNGHIGLAGRLLRQPARAT